MFENLKAVKAVGSANYPLWFGDKIRCCSPLGSSTEDIMSGIVVHAIGIKSAFYKLNEVIDITEELIDEILDRLEKESKYPKDFPVLDGVVSIEMVQEVLETYLEPNFTYYDTKI